MENNFSKGGQALSMIINKTLKIVVDNGEQNGQSSNKTI